MAFEEFKLLEPVIILSEGDETSDDVYNRIEVKDGAEATPDTFNEGIMDSLTRDINLESAITYLARSASLFTTPNTKFLSHCEGEGIDIVANTKPTFETEDTPASSVFVDDHIFIGAAYPQGFIENLMGIEEFTAQQAIWTLWPSMIGNDHQVHTDPIQGWYRRTNEGDVSTPITEAITESDKSDKNGYATITTNTPSTLGVSGDVIYESIRFNPRYHRVDPEKGIQVYCVYPVDTTTNRLCYTQSLPIGTLERIDEEECNIVYFNYAVDLYTTDMQPMPAAAYRIVKISEYYNDDNPSPYKPEYDDKYIVIFCEPGTDYQCYHKVDKDKKFSPAYQAKNLSLGIYIDTDDDLVTSGAYIDLKVNFFDSAGQLIPDPAELRTASLANVKGFKGFLKVQELTLDDKVATVSVEIKLHFSNKPTTFKISKVMAQASDFLSDYVEHSRASSNCQYNATAKNNYLVNLDSLNGGNDVVSLVYWAKFKEESVKSLAEQYMGPIYVTFGSRERDEYKISLGGVHVMNDGQNMDMRLMLSQKLDTGESTVTYSEPIHLPDTAYDKYLLCSLRFRPSEENTEKIIVEYSVVLDNKVLKTLLSIEKSLFGDKYGTILVGRDTAFTAMDFASNSGPFGGPVTEIRVDNEWLNDLELYILALGRKPYTFKIDEAGQSTSREKSATEILDEAGVNLLANPTGRHGIINWNGTTEEDTSFTVQHNDPDLGNCFKFVGNGTAAALKCVYSNKITLPTSASAQYSIRAIMLANGYTESATTGGFLGVRWLNEGEEFDPTDSPLDPDSSDLVLKCDTSGVYKYYSASGYSGTAKYAVVYMYIANGTVTNNIKFSKIKFEKGLPTYFTDDSGADYGIYY